MYGVVRIAAIHVLSSVSVSLSKLCSAVVDYMSKDKLKQTSVASPVKPVQLD